MCSQIRYKSKDITTGAYTVTNNKLGTGYKRFGNGRFWNARIERINEWLKTYNPCFINVDEFKEGIGYFNLPPLDGFELACVEDEERFFIITQSSVGSIVEKYHSRVPIILRDSTSFIKKGKIIDYPISLIKLVA